jgi:hypothetical protein
MFSPKCVLLLRNYANYEIVSAAAWAASNKLQQAQDPPCLGLLPPRGAWACSCPKEPLWGLQFCLHTFSTTCHAMQHLPTGGPYFADFQGKSLPTMPMLYGCSQWLFWSVFASLSSSILFVSIVKNMPLHIRCSGSDYNNYSLEHKSTAMW